MENDRAPGMDGKPVQAVMTRDPVVVATGTTVFDCAKLMRSEDIGSVGVESNGVLFGVLNDRDIVLRAVAGQLDPAETPVEAVCSRGPVTVDPELPVERARRFMAERGVRRLFVARDGRPVGILTDDDLAIRDEPDSVYATQLEGGLLRGWQGYTGQTE